MELRHLRYLVAIADAGTFVRAAERLHVAQPALTRQIHDLEKELNVELFDSRARKATLTPAGEACVRLSRHVIQDTERAVARARLSNSGVVGRCVVASGPLPIITGLVSRFAARMKSRYAGITVVIVERTAADQWEALVNAEADIGLGILPPPGMYPALTMETQQMFAIDHIFVGAGHPLADRSSVKLEELRDVPFLTLDTVTPDLLAARDALVREMDRLGFPDGPGRARELSSFESFTAHVRAGQGWGFGTEPMIRAVPGVVPIRLEGFRAPLRTMRIWRRADKRPVISTVLRELRRMQEDEASGNVQPQEISSRDGAARAGSEEFVPVRLELRHLRSFASVVEHGSLGRAAEMLELTQPALSRQMRELEYDVGVTLMERGTRGISMSPAGEEFVRDVTSVLAIVDHMPSEVIRATRATEQRCLVGSVPHPWMDRLMVQVVTDLESRTPRVRVGFRPIVTPQQPAALQSGAVDIAVGHIFPVQPPRTEVALITLRLFDDRICAVLLPPAHPLAQRDSVRLRDLQPTPFLWVSRSFFPSFHDAVFAKFQAAGLDPRIEAEYDGLRTIWSMAAQGLGWTLGWQSHLQEPPAGLRAVRLDDFDMPWGGALYYRQDESRAPILTAIDAIVAHARQMFGGVPVSDVTTPAPHTPGVGIS